MAVSIKHVLEQGPVIGGLSDQFGRRPVILASLFAFGLDFIIAGLAPNIWWFFAGRVLAGTGKATANRPWRSVER